MAAAASAYILGAAVIIIGDKNPERLAHAKKMGYETIDIGKHDNLSEQIEQIVGVPEVDAAIDAVGFEASAQGNPHEAAPASVLNQLMGITFVAGGIGIPGLYVVEDPGARDVGDDEFDIVDAAVIARCGHGLAPCNGSGRPSIAQGRGQAVAASRARLHAML